MDLQKDSSSKLAMAKTALSAVGSIAASAMMASTVIGSCMPQEIQDYFFSETKSIYSRFKTQLTMVIYEYDGIEKNELYEAAESYLTTRISDDNLRLKVTKVNHDKNIVTAVEKNQELIDNYNNAQFRWIQLCRKSNNKVRPINPHDYSSTYISDVKFFQLSFHKKHKDMVLKSYFPYIMKESTNMKNENKTLKIYTLKNMYLPCPWTAVNLDHPATFEKVAMEASMKERLMEDLKRFVNKKDYYRKVGKAWKRGYLLYGPPGTGKSSLIAAMANYLNFDIYDLELTAVTSNSELRQLLLSTANRSILVIEDIDCTIELKNRAKDSQPVIPKKKDKVTLSGFLNFIDGLWSSCGDERIIVFTTNYKDKLDPALIRAGRMDFHIHMSYCTPSGFKLLANNYLDIKEHPLFGEIKKLIGKSEVTPADVAEQLMKNDDVDDSLAGLIEFLEMKIKEAEEAAKLEQLRKENADKEKKNVEEKKQENIEEKGEENVDKENKENVEAKKEEDVDKEKKETIEAKKEDNVDKGKKENVEAKKEENVDEEKKKTNEEEDEESDSDEDSDKDSDEYSDEDSDEDTDEESNEETDKEEKNNAD